MPEYGDTDTDLLRRIGRYTVDGIKECVSLQ